MFRIHICIFLLGTHTNIKLNLNVGGPAYQVLQLLPSYEKIKDIKISIITRYSEYKPISSRLKIYEIHKFNNFILDTIYFHIKSFFKIVKIHKKDPIDVLNVHQFYHIIISPIIARLIYKIPILMKIPINFESYLIEATMIRKHKFRTKVISFSWYTFFIKFLLKKINFIRPINEKMYEDLISLNYRRNNILKIPNGISNKEFIGLNKTQHNYIHFGFVGRLFEYKNIRFLLDVLKIYFLEYPNDKLFIYGKGPEEKYISDFTASNNLASNIILKGFEKDKTKIYSNLDVLIDTAFAQGISNTNLEAMCTETLVIASDVYGNRDLIEHGKTGLLFNPYKRNDFLKQLIYYKNNSELRMQILNNAKNEVLSNYDIDIIANKIFLFLKSRLSINR